MVRYGIRNIVLVLVVMVSLVYSSPQKVLASEWRTARVSWYGSECYGNKTASGVTYNGSLISFAHRSMRFGTRVEFEYRGRKVTAVCNDRGPFVAGRLFDLSAGTARILGFSGVGTVRWRVVNGKASVYKPKRIPRKRTRVYDEHPDSPWLRCFIKREALQYGRHNHRYALGRFQYLSRRGGYDSD